MRGVPLAYIARNLWVRRVTTVLTAGGMALVVYVFATVLMMSEGIRSTLVATGQPDNVMVLRKGAGAEINSGIERGQAALLSTLPGIATDGLGRPLVSAEPVVLINLPKRSNGKPSNVTVRGTSERGLQLRPGVRIVEGRMFRPGTSEIVVGRATAEGFAGVDLGASLRFAGRDWQIVGRYDASRSGFDSEIWGDAEQMLQAFRRGVYSIVVFRLADAGRFDATRDLIDGDPRLSLEAKPEIRFYAEQSEALATFINILGLSLAVIFSIGAVVGAMITMFAAVASRTGEIGTLRALGFRRRAVLGAFMAESLQLASIGGVLGLAAASAMQAVDVSTTNFQTFAELAFRFVLTPQIAWQSMAFALVMGVVGGFIPAWRAARLQIVDCLRAA
ncbi:ABC transporter permease [Ideonella sp. A 288]|uniref:ABC transporter permease n=1 Tax=Ideonella sp. A 288 TaxID=1962181 RepID=UPI000B4AF012|nr:ABC transporter permease [Ideonella sp. A 288]